MSTVIQYAEPDDIIRAIVKRLVDVAGISRDVIRLSADPLDDSPASSDFVWYNLAMLPKGKVDSPAVDGGGDLQTSIDARLVITVMANLATDDPNHLKLFLTDDGNSIWHLGRKVVKALHMFAIPDATGGPDLLNEPLRLAEFDWSWRRPVGHIQFGFDIQFDWDLS